MKTWPRRGEVGWHLKRPAAVILGALALATVHASAKEYPFAFKQIKPGEVMAFPGGYGTYGRVETNRPKALKAESPPVSSMPLYGLAGDAKTGMIFRLDESENGKGYDLLVMDLNQNGDLRDDPVQKRLPPERKQNLSKGVEQGTFEIQSPNTICGGHPVNYGFLSLTKREIKVPNRQMTNLYLNGYVRFKAGWYLETEIAVPDGKRKVGLYDGDANLRLGDAWPMQTYNDAEEGENWYFRNADSYLLGARDTGSYERGPLTDGAIPFGPLIYVGATPYKVACGTDFKSLQVEPWTEALAEVALTPRGEQVKSVVLAWETAEKQWQLLEMEAFDGKIKVPPGKYRLYQSTLSAKAEAGKQVMAVGQKYQVKPAIEVVAGKANTLPCGAPLTIKVTAVKAKPYSYELEQQEKADGKATANVSEFVLRINGTVLGAGEERYSGFGMINGKEYESPAKPVYTIRDGDGKEVAKGNLEFG